MIDLCRHPICNNNRRYTDKARGVLEKTPSNSPTVTRDGVGKHIEAAPPGAPVRFLRLLYVFQAFYVVTPGVIKLSLLFLYRRIFVGQRFLRLVYTLMALVTAWMVAMELMSIFGCQPIRGYWTREGHCVSLRDYAVALNVINIVFGLVVWTMPLPLIWRLQLPIAQRVGLACVFTLGLL